MNARRFSTREALADALFAGVLVAPFALLSTSGVTLVIGAFYAGAYCAVMLPGLAIGMLFLIDSGRAAFGYEMAWVPFMLKLSANADENVMRKSSRQPGISGNLLLHVTVFGSMIVAAWVPRARRAFLNAQRDAEDCKRPGAHEKMPARAPVYVADRQLRRVTMEHTGEFAVA